MAATGIFGAADAARVLLTQQSAELAEPDRASQQPGRFAAHADGNLAEAVTSGRLIDVCLMLEAGVELEVPDHHGRMPLHAAIENCGLSMSSLLLSSGADPDSCDGGGNTALHLAAGMRPTDRGHDDKERAAQSRHSMVDLVDLVERLLQAGASCDIQNDKKQTPADVANTPALRKLLTLNRKVKQPQSPTKRSSATTPTPGRSSERSSDLPDCRACSTGAHTAHTCGRGHKRAAVAAAAAVAVAAAAAAAEIAEAAEAAGLPVSPNLRILSVEDLRDAIKEGNMTTVKRAAKLRHVDLDVLDDEGWSCLHLACAQGLDEVSAILLRHGADPNVRTAQQDTALHCATFGKHYQIAELLLKNGAIPTYKNNDGLSSIDLAEAPSAIRDLLVSFDESAEVAAAAADPEDGAQAGSMPPRKVGRPLGSKNKKPTMLSSSFKGGTGKPRGRPPKDKAKRAAYEAAAVMAATTPSVASIDITVQKLHQAMKSGTGVKTAIKNCKDILQPDLLGRTALHIGAQFNQLASVELILEAGAQIDTPGPRSSTALHLAAEAGHVQMAALLVETGAVLTTGNHNGQTPAEVASQPRMVAFFTSLGPARYQAQTKSKLAEKTEVAAVAAVLAMSKPAKPPSGRSGSGSVAKPAVPRLLLLDPNPRPEEFDVTCGMGTQVEVDDLDFVEFGPSEPRAKPKVPVFGYAPAADTALPTAEGATSDAVPLSPAAASNAAEPTAQQPEAFAVSLTDEEKAVLPLAPQTITIWASATPD